MGCSASRSDGLEHEEALQHVIQMMRELKVKQIANIAARREGRRSREKYYGWAGVQGARAIAGGDAVLRKASISHANWRRGGPIDVVAPPGTLLDLSLLLDLGAGGLADGINSLQADGGTGERLLEHFVSIRGEGSRAPPMWGLLSLSLETSSCVIYTFFQRSGNRERYAVVIRGVICGLS